MDGYEATRILRKKLPQMKVVGLSMLHESESAEAMLAAGACAYLNKSGPSRDIARAIRNCMPRKPRPKTENKANRETAAGQALRGRAPDSLKHD